MSSEIQYKEKYLKYKAKYLHLFNILKGGTASGLLNESTRQDSQQIPDMWKHIIEESTDCYQIVSLAKSTMWLRNIIIENIIRIIHRFIKSLPLDNLNTRAFWVNIFGQYINLDANAEEYINLLLDATITKDVLYNLFEETCTKYKLYEFLVNEVKLENLEALNYIEDGFSMLHYTAMYDIVNHPIFNQGINLSQVFNIIIRPPDADNDNWTDNDFDNFEYFIQNLDLDFVSDYFGVNVIEFKKKNLFKLFNLIKDNVAPSIQQVVTIFNGINRFNGMDRTSRSTPLGLLVRSNYLGSNLKTGIIEMWNKANEGLNVSDEQKVINTINYINSNFPPRV